MKTLKILSIIFAVFFAVWAVGQYTGMLRLYSIPVITNYPSLQLGDHVISSNLVAPKRFDFICYSATSPEYQNEIWVHRVCGIEGDIVEIKNGVLFVNGRNADSGLPLAHDYNIHVDDFDRLNLAEQIREEDFYQYTTDSVATYLPDYMVSKNSLRAKRVVRPKEPDKFIDSIYSSSGWSVDHFGPVTVPKNKYFVLGDNRNRANDSRFTGFIKKSNLIGTLVSE